MDDAAVTPGANGDHLRPGCRFVSRDEQYEPGRTLEVVGGDLSLGNGFIRLRCIANPKRPQTVGKVATIRRSTLRARWRHVDQ